MKRFIEHILSGNKQSFARGSSQTHTYTLIDSVMGLQYRSSLGHAWLVMALSMRVCVCVFKCFCWSLLDHANLSIIEFSDHLTWKQKRKLLLTHYNLNTVKVIYWREKKHEKEQKFRNHTQKSFTNIHSNRAQAKRIEKKVRKQQNASRNDIHLQGIQSNFECYSEMLFVCYTNIMCRGKWCKDRGKPHNEGQKWNGNKKNVKKRRTKLRNIPIWRIIIWAAGRKVKV